MCQENYLPWGIQRYNNKKINRNFCLYYLLLLFFSRIFVLLKGFYKVFHTIKTRHCRVIYFYSYTVTAFLLETYVLFMLALEDFFQACWHQEFAMLFFYPSRSLQDFSCLALSFFTPCPVGASLFTRRLYQQKCPCRKS